MRRLSVLLIGCSTLLTCFIAHGAQTLAITRVSIVDVATGSVLSDSTVTIDGDKIAGIAPHGKAPAGARIVDGRGTFLIPGLWDMHAHSQTAGAESLDLYLASGVVGFRDMGADADFVLPLRDRIARGELMGPEIIAAGPILDDAPGNWPMRLRVRNAEEARAAVRLLKGRGVDLIKVHNHTPREAFFAIAEEARKQGLPLAGHVPLRVTMQEAVAAGMASIEHLSESRLFRECTGRPAEYDRSRCLPLFEQLAANHVWQTPTLGFSGIFLGTAAGKPMPHQEYASDATLEFTRQVAAASPLDAAAISYFREMRSQSNSVIRDLLPLGNWFLAGCDGGVPGFCLQDELQELTKAGLSPLQAIQSATINPAKYLGREKTAGTIAVGKRADLVLLDANPLLDIRNAQRVAAVVVRGRVLTRADIDRMLAARRRSK